MKKSVLLLIILFSLAAQAQERSLINPRQSTRPNLQYVEQFTVKFEMYIDGTIRWERFNRALDDDLKKKISKFMENTDERIFQAPGKFELTIVRKSMSGPYYVRKHDAWPDKLFPLN